MGPLNNLHISHKAEATSIHVNSFPYFLHVNCNLLLNGSALMEEFIYFPEQQQQQNQCESVLYIVLSE